MEILADIGGYLLAWEGHQKHTDRCRVFAGVALRRTKPVRGRSPSLPFSGRPGRAWQKGRLLWPPTGSTNAWARRWDRSSRRTSDNWPLQDMSDLTPWYAKGLTALGGLLEKIQGLFRPSDLRTSQVTTPPAASSAKSGFQPFLSPSGSIKPPPLPPAFPSLPQRDATSKTLLSDSSLHPGVFPAPTEVLPKDRDRIWPVTWAAIIVGSGFVLLLLWVVVFRDSNGPQQQASLDGKAAGGPASEIATPRTKPQPSAAISTWITISYADLLDRDAIIRTGQNLGSALHDSRLRKAVQPFVDGYSQLLPAAIEITKGPDQTPCHNVLDFFAPGERQPAWVAIFRGGRIHIVTDDKNHAKIFLLGTIRSRHTPRTTRWFVIV